METKPHYILDYRNPKKKISQKDSKDALEICNSFIQTDPSDYFFYMARAFFHSNMNDYKSALVDSDKAIKLANNLDEGRELVQISDAYFNRGNIHFFEKKYELAVNDYSEAIDLDSDSNAYFNCATAHLFLGKHELALRDYKEMLLNKSPETFKDDDEIRNAFISAGNLANNMKNYNEAREFFEFAFQCAPDADQIHEIMYIKSVDIAEENDHITDEHNKAFESETKQKVAANKALKAKEKELEDMMSMFAHKFRSPLDAIIYNTNHENNPKLYIEAAQTMRGLLDIFSIISTDDKILCQKIKADSHGNSNLSELFSNNLNMILLHFLSVSGAEKIRQHYISYAKANGLCDVDISPKTWNEECFKLEQSLQAEWEQSYSTLLLESASLEKRLSWLEQHFFKLELQGFEDNPIRFQKYATTESFLTIISSEILVNAFKYYSSESKQSVVLQWESINGYQELNCSNPSTRYARSRIKGSSKGHTFLSALAHKTGCEFNKPELQDNFSATFKIPNQLLITE